MVVFSNLRSHRSGETSWKGFWCRNEGSEYVWGFGAEDTFDLLELMTQMYHLARSNNRPPLPFGVYRKEDEEIEAQQLDYAEQTQLIAKKAKLALVNRQIEDLKKAKKTISADYSSADAQLALAEVRREQRQTGLLKLERRLGGYGRSHPDCRKRVPSGCGIALAGWNLTNRMDGQQCTSIKIFARAANRRTCLPAMMGKRQQQTHRSFKPEYVKPSRERSRPRKSKRTDSTRRNR